jgi:hypothetical protein
MIDLAAPVRTVSGVTIFGDHADPKRFHFVPIRPRLVTDEDGKPELSLLKYHLDPATNAATGAALFQLTVDLAVSDDVLTLVRNKMAAAVGSSGITLTPVWADSGSCRLILLDSGSQGQLVENVLGGADPDLASNGRTMFVTTLEPDGSAIVEQALRQGGLPFGVVYNLQVAGLRPAMHATITADYRSCYHYYENRLHGGQLLLATDVGATTQDLVQQQALRVVVDDLVPDADKGGVYQQALDQVQQYVLDTLFTPTITQTPAASDDGTSIGSVIKGLVGLFTITYSLQTVDDTELKTLSYVLDVAQAEEITLSPQGELTALLPPGLAADSVIRTVDPAPPDQLDMDVASLVDLAAEAIDHVDVTLTYDGKDTVVRLDEATLRATQSLWYSAAAGPEAQYRYQAELAATGPKGLTGTLTSASATSLHDLIRIDPRQLYQRVELRPSVQGVPFDRFPRVIVDVEAHEALDGWTCDDTVELTAATPEAAVAYRGRPDGLVTLRARVRYVRASGDELAGDWHDVDPGTLVIGDPEPDDAIISVLASARFGTAVVRLVVELRGDATPDAVGTLTFDASTTAAAWSYQPADPGRSYHYRVTVQTTAGEVKVGDWLAGPSGSTLVVGEGFSELRTVRIAFVGTTLTAAGKLAGKIRMTYADVNAHLSADDEFLVQDPAAPLSWSYPVADPSNADYTMTITWITADGTEHAESPRVGSELVQVVAVTP